MRYISELEQKVQTLQTEATTLSAQLTILQVSIAELMILPIAQLLIVLLPFLLQSILIVHLFAFLTVSFREILQRLQVRTMS